MPSFQVQYHSALDNRWQDSAHSGDWSGIRAITESRWTGARPYRARTAHDMPWEFVPIEAWPMRYRAVTEGGEHSWYSQIDNVPFHQFPVMDCLYMEFITEPPSPPAPSTPWTAVAQTTEGNTMTTTATPPPQDALVQFVVGRHEGRLTLEVHAKPLHDLLDSMGARSSGSLYADRPATSVSTVGSNGKMSTELLLRREYPVRIGLAGCYTRPPTHKQLKELCESGHAAVSTILDHYRPVDIRYTILKVAK